MQEANGSFVELISYVGTEKLREIAPKEQAPKEFLRRGGAELLSNLGLLLDETLPRAGLLLVVNSD